MAIVTQPVAGFSADMATDLSDKQVQKRLSPAARKAFFKIANAWKIRDEEAKQLLGGISNGAFYQLKGGESEDAARPGSPGSSVPHGRNLQGSEHSVQSKAGGRLDLPAQQQPHVCRRYSAGLHGQGRTASNDAGATAAGCAASRLMKLPPVIQLRQDDTHRLVPSKYADHPV